LLLLLLFPSQLTPLACLSAARKRHTAGYFEAANDETARKNTDLWYDEFNSNKVFKNTG
jgi:hypothetical protein